MADNHYKSLERRILASMILVPVIPFILVLGIGYYYFTQSIKTDTFARMNRIVEDHVKTIELFLDERKSDLDFVINSYTYAELSNPTVLHKVFRDLQQKSNAFVDLGVFDQNGMHVAYEGPFNLAGRSYRDTPWFIQVMDKGWFISDVFLGYREVPHFIMAVARRNGDQTWILRATIDTLLFNSIVGKVRIGKTGEAYILNRDNVFQTERRSGGDLLEIDQSAVSYLAPEQEAQTFVEQNIDGTTYLYVTALLKNGDWRLVVRQEKADVFGALRRASLIILLVMVGAGVLIVATAYFMTSRITHRVQRADQEKSQLSQQLIVAGRLAEIGEMSAGFAHEINNPLQIIRAEQSLMQVIFADMRAAGKLADSEDLNEFMDSMDQIQVQVDRCAAITQSILKFARQKEAVEKDVDVRKLIPETVDMVANKASVDGVAIDQDVPAQVPLIRADASQLQQVLVNLFNNALDAIRESHPGGGGRLAVTVQAEDWRLSIAVADNGCGISPENLEKIFTPFFSTKAVGKGTGLGLSICYGIVKQMGGLMEVSSAPGQGTTFIIHLPTGEKKLTAST